MLPDLISINTAAQVAGTSRYFVQRAIDAGRLEVSQDGARVLVKLASLEALIGRRITALAFVKQKHPFVVDRNSGLDF